MENFLYTCVEFVAKIHDQILHWNDLVETSFTDKELHFLVMGVLGLALYLFIHWAFKYLSKLGLWAVSFVTALVMMVVISFAIEIGQRITGTGAMDLADIMFGMWGFVLFTSAFIAIGALIGKLVHRHGKKGRA